MNRGLGLVWNSSPVLPGQTPSTIQGFDSLGSVMHLGLGAVAGAVPPEWALLIFSVFLGYEAGRAANGKPWSQIGGSLVEFATGMGAVLLCQKGVIQ